MSGHNKYIPGYRPSQLKHHEWRTAENSAAFLLPRLQEMSRQNPKLKLLDVGAGSGTITSSLAKYMPEGVVTATDLSQTVLDRARDLAKQAGVGHNIEYKQADVYRLPFADGEFDVTHAHQVLAHLDAPVDAVREMIRVTRPGGTVALRESDMRTWCCWPETPAIERFYQILCQVHEFAGGSTNAGRRLLSWALEAGASIEQIEPGYGTWCYSREDAKVWADALASRLREGEMRTIAVEQGFATEAELDDIAICWEKWTEAKDASLGMMHGELLIRR